MSVAPFVQRATSEFSRRWSTALLIFYVLAPVAVGLSTVAGAVRYSALPLENNDEAAHTFIDEPLFQSAARDGVLLKINLGQNFGTPLLGDPVVCPLAPHALTYLAFAPVTAMLVNKVVLGTLSVAVLTAFFAAYYRLPVASICAVLAFTSTSFLYFFHNHPHQGALLYFTLLTLAIRAFLARPSRRGALLVCAAALTFDVGVGIHGVLLGTVFVAAFTLLASSSGWRARAVVLAICGVAAVSFHPHFAEFVRLIGMSSRIHLNYQALFTMSPWDFWRGLIWTNREIVNDRETIYYSPAVLVLVVAGLLLSWRRPSRQVECRLALVLGLMPLLAVTLLRVTPALSGSIPLIRATNVTRVLWFSDVFLMLAVGVAVDTLAARRLSRTTVTSLIVLSLAVLLPRGAVAWWQLNAFHTDARATVFQPAHFLEVMQRGTRLAADIDPVPENFDLKAIPHGLLASSGRSILLNDRFRTHLLSEDLIQIGWLGMSYYFKASAPERLARLGIRYFATRTHAVESQRLGWRPIADDSGLVLFESPLSVTPVYIDGDSPEFLTTYEIRGNDVSIDLPNDRRDYRVVATFLAIPGWKAAIDSQAVPVETGPDGMLAVQVHHGRRVTLTYEPYSDGVIFASFVSSMALLLLGAKLICPSADVEHEVVAGERIDTRVG